MPASGVLADVWETLRRIISRRTPAGPASVARQVFPGELTPFFPPGDIQTGIQHGIIIFPMVNCQESWCGLKGSRKGSCLAQERRLFTRRVLDAWSCGQASISNPPHLEVSSGAGQLFRHPDPALPGAGFHAGPHFEWEHQMESPGRTGAVGLEADQRFFGLLRDEDPVGQGAAGSTADAPAS